MPAVPEIFSFGNTSCMDSGKRRQKVHPQTNYFFATITPGMSLEGSPDISTLLAAWGGGDAQALPRLMSAIYPELRRIARQHLGGRRDGQTLESAALANEAYLKLIR